MAYNVKWQQYSQTHCIQQAEEHTIRDWTGGNPPTNRFLYRFMEQTYASSDPWGADDNWSFNTYVELQAFCVRSITPCGWTIQASNGAGWRFISRDSQKQFALPTIEDAKISYIARKKKQAAIYQARAAKALRCIQLPGDPLDQIMPLEDRR